MGKISKTARASTRGKREEAVYHVNSKGEKVQRVLVAGNRSKKFSWMNEAGELFDHATVGNRER